MSDTIRQASFDVGDRVRWTGGGMTVGAVGTVTALNDDDSVSVRWDDGVDGRNCDPGELAHDYRGVREVVDDPDAPRPIVVWMFDDAPEELQALSTNGGDEDYIAVLPPSLADRWFAWLDEGSSFGCCTVEEHDMPDGSRVLIGCHA